MNRFEKVANPRSFAGKVISVILTISLALMMWDVNAMNYAFATDDDATATQQETQAKDKAEPDKADKAAPDKADKAEKAEKASKSQAADEPAPAASHQESGSDEGSDAAADPAPASDPEPEAAQTPADDSADTPAADESGSEEAGTPETPAGEEAGTGAEGDQTGKEEAEEDEVTYPVQDFEGVASGVTVNVHAPAGALPEGTKMDVAPVDGASVEGIVGSNVAGKIESIEAVEIGFTDKDGKKVSPKANVAVTLSSGLIPQAAADENLTVTLVRTSGEAVGVVDADNDGAAMKFDTQDIKGFALALTSPADEEAAQDEQAATEQKPEAKKKLRGAAKGEEPEMITVTFDPTTDPSEPQQAQTIEVEKGTPIGDQLPAVPEVPGYKTKWVIDGTTTEVTSDTVVDEPFTAVVEKGEKITYTVTFVQEDGTTETRTTDIDSGFAINNLPEVAPKTNKIGKWVYPGTSNEFTVGTVVSGDLTVNAAYEQSIFTVEFMVDGTHYEEMTTAAGTNIVLPSDPIKEGATFKGWFTEPGGLGTQYTAESTVSEDLTLYAYFEGQVTVKFLVKDDSGDVIAEKSQYFIDLTAGDQITTLPDDPFVEGKVFSHWAKGSEEGETVTAGYTVTESFDAVAVFKSIDTYELTVNYFYMNDENRVEVGSQVYDLVESDFPYTVTAPGYTIASEIPDQPTYYPSQPTITVTKDQFSKPEGGDKYVYTVEDEFVAADANYKVGHYLKNLDGEGYVLIETVDKVGVKNSKVTPDINSYAYVDFESRDENVTITGDASQELKVYYERRDFTLSYNVAGGDYIEAVTEPYGTEITLPTNATRAGYTFDGWYKDSACTQPADSSITLEANTTLYAKWIPAQVNYQIVYMIENANDDGYSYLATVTKQAQTDSEVTMTAATAGANGTRPSDLDTQNFTFKDSTTETVKADGTTVVTVRYSRNVYTLQGRTSSNYGFDNTTEISGATVTAKYGSDITQAWTNHFNNRSGSWSFNNQNNSKFKSLTIMPGLDVREYGSGNTIYVFNHNDTAAYYQHLEYWLQNYTGEGVETTTHNGKTYGRVKAVDMRYNYLSNTDDWYEITGYTKAGYTAEHRRYENTGTWQSFTYSWGTRFSNYGNQYTYTRFNFYYDAKEYPLTFYNYDGTLISTQSVTLGNDISGYLTDNVPSAPMEGATWKGWYTSSEHTEGTEYNGGTKMPAGLVLYGDFALPTRTVTFDSQGGSTVNSQTHEHGFYATTPADPTKDNYTFQGWFTAPDETGAPYDWNQPVTEDITLYARWTQDTISYTVHYYEAGTTTSVLPDKTVSDPAFIPDQEVTESAPTVAGHVVDATSKTLSLSFDEEENVITFYYSAIPEEITYTVNYVLQGTNIQVHAPKTVTVPGSTTNVLELAAEVDPNHLATQTSDADILGKHYRPTENSKELQLALENNVITFEYIPYTTTKITVNYFDMDGNEISVPDTAYIEKGDTYTLQNKAPDGFVYHHAYLDGTTTAPQPTYQITGNEGDLVINVYYQRKLIIVASNKSKTYDGTALNSSFATTTDYTVTGLTRGDTLTSLQFDGSQTNAGTSATTPKNAEVTLGATGRVAPEEYYSIIYVPGSLTVKPVSVYISVSADQWTTHSGSTGGPNYYTGQAFNVGFTNPNKQHFNDGSGSAYVSVTSGQRTLFMEKYRDAIWSALYGTNGALISEKDAGTYTVTGAEQRAKLAAVSVDGQNMMSDPNYSVTLYARDSLLKIEPLPLNITTPSDTKAYDGTALEKSEGATLDHSYWTANTGGTWTAATTAAPGSVTLGTGETITFNVTGSQTPVGKSDNTYSIDWGENKSSNYKVNATLGNLEVTSATLTIAVKDKTTTYSGLEQSGNTIATVTGTGETIDNDAYTVTGLAEGDVLTVSYTPATGTNAGTHENGEFAEAAFSVVNAAGTDVTEFYTLGSTTPGKLTIDPAPVTITTGSASKPYDGTALTNDEATITGLVNNETATVTATGSQTLVGSSDNTYSIEWGTANENNYTITDDLGTLTVTDENIDGKLVVTKDDGKEDSYKYQVDDEVTWTVTATNVYAEPKTITLSEIAGVTLAQSTFENVAAGETVETTATYTVTQADVDAGTFVNTVTATIGSKSWTATDTINMVDADPELTVTKSASKTTDAAVDDEITYTVVVKNTGNVTVKGIALSDTLVTLSEAAFDLAPGDEKTITYNYTVTQADVDAGKIDNTVTAAGKDPKGGDVEKTASATVTTVEAVPALTVTKTASKNTNAAVDDVITYTVIVENTGNVTVKGIALSDTLVTLSEAAFDLAPGDEKTITYNYTVTQADVDAGKIDNTVTAKGKDPKGGDVEETASATVNTVTPAAELAVTKTPSKTTDAAVGDEITYTVVVKNTGNVTVKGIALSDTLVTLSEAAFDLAPGDEKTIIYNYTVTQADVDAGKIDNTVTATGKDPKGEDVTGTKTVTVTTVEANPAITVVKTADKTSDVKAGDTVTYTVVVTNTGNVTVKEISLDDTLVEQGAATFDLAPNGTKTITYTYVVKQSDVDAGEIDNTATATGKDPKGADVTASDDETVTTEAAEAKLSVTKAADPTEDVAVGDTVTYTVVVTNTGNVSVKDGTLDDDHADLSDKTFNLAPGKTAEFTYEYEVTQADVDAGEIVNVVKANATAERGKNPAEVTATATVTTEDAAAELSITKTAVPTEGVGVDDTITYTVAVKNTGNVTVKDGALVDDHADLSDKTFNLVPNATAEFTYTYTVTQADVDAGKVVNVVKANATAERGADPAEVEATATVTTEDAAAKLSITKTASPTSGVKAGDTVTYTVVVKNEGNVSVKDGTLEDDHADLSDKTFNLEPGASETFTYTYTVKQSDIDAGEIVNVVKANATAARGDDPEEVEATATVTTEEAKPELTVEKTANPTENVEVGSTVTYTVVVTNTGNVTVKDIAMTDSLVTLNEATFTLAPSDTKTITYTYTVKQSDVDAGKIDNTATATGKDPKDKDVTANGSATVTTVAADAKIALEKKANPTTGVKLGDTVTYTFTVENTGNVTVSSLTLADPLEGIVLGALDKTAIGPGEKATATATYKVTQADVDAGKIDNTATATGKDPSGEDVTDTASATVTTVDSEAELTVTKTASPTSGVKVDDIVTYTVVVTNSGNVTVKGIELEDALMADADVPEAFDLAPDASETFTYTYKVTQADVDAGKITNTVTATGKDPKDQEVSGSATAEVTTVAADAELKVEKTADPASGVEVGDIVNYKVVVTNSGNVTVSGITLQDTKMSAADAPGAFTLAPTETKTIEYTYTVTQDDVDAGKIDNTATATGKDPKGEDVTESDDAEVTTVKAAPELKVEKTANPASGVKVGDTVTYTVKVTNSGNVTVTGIEMEDTLVTLSEEAFTLAPGAEKTITYAYTVKQSDVDAGTIENTATATGKDPKDGDVTASDDATVTTVAAAPELTVAKTASPASGVGVGDTVTYTVKVTNSGNVTVSNIKLADTLVTPAGANAEAFDLAPGAEKTLTYTYTVKQADVDAGKIENTATATGKDPSGNDVTASDNAEVTTVAADAKLTVEKTADPTEDVAVGDTVTYTVKVTNSGNVTVKGIAMSDTLVNLNEAAFDLAPAGTKTITYTYTVTQDDVDAGKIDNTATATGKDPKNSEVKASDGATVTTVAADAELTVKKSANQTSNLKVGDTVTYTVVVTNSGNVTVKDIAMSDTLVTLNEQPFTLAPEGTNTITYEYTVTQDDVDAGTIENTATATGKDPKDNKVEASDTVTVTTVAADAKLTVVKTANPSEGVEVGETVNYKVVVTNTGNVTVKGIAMTDSLVTLNEAPFDLAPNANKTINYTYTVTQADVDAGKIDNTATATGKDPKNNEVKASGDATVTTVEAKPELTVEKTAAPTSGVKVGDIVNYTVVVTNTGNVTVKGIAMSDTLVTLNEAAFDLAPAGTKTITYTYTVTQADVDAGKIDNTATAIGKDPKNNEVTASDDATVTTVAAEPELTVEKTASPTSGVKVGDEVTYTVKVTNSGNVTVTGIELEDALMADADAPEAFTLAPAGTKTVTYTYTVTQDDVDAGTIENTATATGKDPSNKDVTASDEATVTTVESAAELTVEKTANPAEGVEVGDKVTYTVVVTNSGNVTVRDIEMSDTLVTLNEDAFDLAPEGTKTITYEYTVTQADVDAGKIDNTAAATGKDPKDEDVSGSDSAEVTTVEANAALTVEKTADPASGVKVDDTVTYTVKVTNTGNVTVGDITLADTLVDLSADNAAAFTLAPGKDKTFTYTYTVTQADVDAGKIDNTATATGTDPKNNEVTAKDSAEVTTVEAEPELTVEKSAEPTSGVAVDDEVTYTVKVTNTGNVTVSDITLADTLVEPTGDNAAAFTLAPGKDKTFTYKYTVTQADVDAGAIENTATATGEDPSGKEVTASDDAEVKTETADPGLKITKEAEPTSGVAVGDEVTYTVTVENVGNVTVSNIELEDTLVQLTEEAFELAPKGKKEITYTYTVTQADVDAGEIDNTATATGKDPKGEDVEPVTASAKVTTEAAEPKLTVEKSADPTENVAVGDTVTYTVKVTNSGNVTVTGIEMEDTLVELSEEAFTLAPGKDKTFTYEYTVKQSDVDAGTIENTATATGKDPKNGEVKASDDAEVTTVEAEPKLTVEKTADPTENVAVGEEVTYTVVVTNSGNVTVKGVELEDALMAEADAPEAFDLAPAGTKTITYKYTVTQADVDAGTIENTATATGEDPSGEKVTASDTATVTTVEAEPELTVEKSANPIKDVKVGDPVTYTVVVTNSGNVTVTGIEMEDTLVTLSEEAFTLAPSETKTITYEYTVTQADVDAGKIDNTATATGEDPKNNEVTASDDATVTTVAANPALTVEKTANPTEDVAVGDTVTYTVVVTNTGNVTVTGIELEDALMAAADAPEAFTLAPAGTKTITYEYTVTQADVDAGTIENTATATGKDPKDGDVTASDTATVATVKAEPELTVEKSATPTSGVVVDSVITYTVKVTNSGNVTVKGITLADELMAEADAPEPFTLAPDEDKTITYTYTVTQDDVDAGKVDNTATATGKDPKDADVTASDDATVTTVESDAQLTVKKTAAPTEGLKVGDTVTYTVVVTNSGNVTVKGITLADELMAEADAPEPFTLAPGKDKTITYTYTVTQDDVDAGKVVNTATATGKDPKGNEIGTSDMATVETEAAEAKLSVTKAADPTENVKVGDTVTYTVVVKNEGNVSVKDGTLEDDHVNLSDKTFNLAPGKTAEFTYEYEVTQADVDAGEIVNVVKANATAERGKNPAEVEATATVATEDAAAKLSITKTAAPTEGVGVGDTITYTVAVRNTGNVTVKDGTLSDDHTDLSGEAFTLAPNVAAIFTYDYRVTQADVDAGEIVNVVKANATAARGDDPEEVTATATVTTEDAEPKISVTKAADPAKDVEAGDTITYTVVVKNEGNVSLKGIELSDTLVDLSEEAFDLAPDTTKEITYTYEVTQDDVDAGNIDNTVTATGTDARNGQEQTDTASVTVPTVPKNAEVTTTKEVTSTGSAEGGKYKAGETVTYKITVTNTGNVTLFNVNVKDTLSATSESAKVEFTELDGGTLGEDNSVTFEKLAVGATKTLTATYTVTQDDVDAQKTITNAVASTGEDPQGDDPTPKDPDPVPVDPEDPKPHITTSKSSTGTPTGLDANGKPGYKAGDKLTYKIDVTNDGNLTASNITVEDEKLGYTEDKPFVYEKSIAPGETVTVLEHDYVVTKADVKAGSVFNKATVTGTTPGDDPDPSTDTDEKPTEVLYVITYDLNGGTYNGSKADIHEEYPLNEVITIHKAPVREGYTFLYWKGSSFQPGDKYTVKGNHTFVAQWEKNSKPTPTPTVKVKKTQDQKVLPKTGDEAPIQQLLITSLMSLFLALFAGRRLTSLERAGAQSR